MNAEVNADTRMAYAARCRCGCGAIRAATSDDKGFEADTAEFVSDLIKDGYTVERIPVSECNLGACKQRKAAKVEA